MEILRMQDPRIITLSASVGTIRQAENLATNVARARFVTPWIRVIRDPANTITLNNVKFRFYSAALIQSGEDSPVWGERFILIDGYEITIDQSFSGGGANGASFTGARNAGKIASIENPGGLLIWEAALYAGSTATFKFEIDLVARP
jgi:hypothetical protein